MKRIAAFFLGMRESNVTMHYDDDMLLEAYDAGRYLVWDIQRLIHWRP